MIPTQATPSQTFSVLLSGQNCQIDIYQKAQGLFLNLFVDGTMIVGGVICENRNRIVRDAYFGFIGDLAFVDLQGNSDPDYRELGSRFILVYIPVA